VQGGHCPSREKDNEDDNEMSDEIADVLFTIICLANSKDIDLDKAFQKTMDKCYGRDKDRFEKK